MLYREIIAVCAQIHTKRINTLCGQNVELVNVKCSVRTAQLTHSVSVTQTSKLMLYREIIAVCFQIQTKHTKTLCGQNVELVNVKCSVRTAQLTHSVSVIQTSQLMLYREIIAVCAQIHTKHINTLCGQNVELVNDKCSVRTAL